MKEPKICILLGKVLKISLTDDAIPFVRDGRNVIHGFIEGVDDNIAPGLPCLIVDSNGDLVAHGVSRCTSNEILKFTKGIAIRTRGGIKILIPNESFRQLVEVSLRTITVQVEQVDLS